MFSKILSFQVMTETNTLINWPARLKIGARSKKGKIVMT